jgi:hypothetical protein
MSLIRIEQIYLYTDQAYDEDGLTDPNTDSAKAIQWLQDNSIIDYTHLNYADPQYHPDCFAPLNTWYFSNRPNHTLTAFPFLYYTEVHDNLPVNQMPMVLLDGLDEIKNSNLAELYQLGK